MTYKDRLEKISQKADDHGLIHSGYVSFIQCKLSDEDGFPFLKAAIYGILEEIPGRIPYDLPEQVEATGEEDYDPTDDIIDALFDVQSNLIMPIDGYDIIRVIKAAREYEKKYGSEQE